MLIGAQQPDLVPDPHLQAIDVALAFTMPMGICEAASSLVIGRLIDRQLPPRYSTSLAPPT